MSQPCLPNHSLHHLFCVVFTTASSLSSCTCSDSNSEKRTVQLSTQQTALKEDVNAKDSDDVTALMRAAGMWHLEVVRTLITAGAHVNAKDNEGFSPLAWARKKDNADIELLEKAVAAWCVSPYESLTHRDGVIRLRKSAKGRARNDQKRDLAPNNFLGLQGGMLWAAALSLFAAP